MIRVPDQADSAVPSLSTPYRHRAAERRTDRASSDPLGALSVRVTEKHTRQDQLEADLTKAWSRDAFLILKHRVYGRYTLNYAVLTDIFSTG